uniref:type I protein arginine methyltransferase n=1 Tax=Oryzias melastigma TaxID=30732 RepID=A0A3B3BW71_ORYME
TCFTPSFFSTCFPANRSTVFQLTLCEKVDRCRVGRRSFLVCVGKLNLLLQFASSTGQSEGVLILKDGSKIMTMSLQVHNYLCQQQNLLQDYLRTATYQKAFLANEDDFKDKVVLDVCSGSGILSFFAVQAGASRVFALESSPVAEYIQVLVRANKLSEQIVVLEGQVEDLSLPVMVDVIVFEPVGYLLLSERLMQRFLHARRWLKPNGRMFPSCADLHLAPFSDEQLYLEQHARVNFWQQRSFYGVDLSALHNAAADEFFRYPVVDSFDGHILVGRSVKHRINFMELKDEDLHRIEIPFVFTLLQSGLVHGLAFWFDLAFLGSRSTVWLSTAPSEPLTRWSQVRCLLQTPLFAKLGQTLSGTALLASNSRYFMSYDIQITATVDQSGFRSGNKLDLKNPFFNAFYPPSRAQSASQSQTHSHTHSHTGGGSAAEHWRQPPTRGNSGFRTRILRHMVAGIEPAIFRSGVYHSITARRPPLEEAGTYPTREKEGGSLRPQTEAEK